MYRRGRDVGGDAVHQLRLERRRVAGHRVDLGEAQVRTDGLRRIEHAMAGRDAERNHRMHRLDGDIHVFQRVHAQRFLPAHFVGLRRLDGAVPAHTVDDLHVDQVEVHRVRVDAVVRDLPDLGLAILDRVQIFDRRIDVGQWNSRGDGGGGERQFRGQRGVHAAEDRVEQFLNGLVDDLQAVGRDHGRGACAVRSGRREGDRVGAVLYSPHRGEGGKAGDRAAHD